MNSEIMARARGGAGESLGFRSKLSAPKMGFTGAASSRSSRRRVARANPPRPKLPVCRKCRREQGMGDLFIGGMRDRWLFGVNKAVGGKKRLTKRSEGISVRVCGRSVLCGWVFYRVIPEVLSLLAKHNEEAIFIRARWRAPLRERVQARRTCARASPGNSRRTRSARERPDCTTKSSFMRKSA